MQWNHQTYSGWGRVQFSSADMARPERQGHMAALIRDSEQLLPVGNLRSYGDAALTPGARAVTTQRLDRFLSFDPKTGILEAESGVTMGTLVQVFAPKGWIPPVIPGTGMTTLGGALANDIHGKNHHNVGSIGLHVDAFTLITADGRVHIVTPGDPLFKATIGGVGQTGFISTVTLRMMPTSSMSMKVNERRIPDLDSFIDAFHTSNATYEVGWIDALAKGSALGRGLLEEADFAETRGTMSDIPQPKTLPPLPGFALMTPVVRAFNWAYFHRVPKAGRTRIRPLQKFFFPLDRLANWNMLYGRQGFHQFQCVLPDVTARETLRAMLKQVSDSGLASPLAVLKRMGKGRAGHLSFAMEGFTLALDIPNRTGARVLLTRLEAMTVAAGGRIYLAKDGVTDHQSMDVMYPELEAYSKVVESVDPEGKFTSILAQRLHLRSKGRA